MSNTVHTVYCGKMKNVHTLSLTGKNFVKSILYKNRYFHEIFAKKCVRVNFRNFHTVQWEVQLQMLSAKDFYPMGQKALLRGYVKMIYFF